MPGDSEISTFDFKYDKDLSVSLDVDLPPLPDAKQIYYFRPVITNGLGDQMVYGRADEAWPAGGRPEKIKLPSKCRSPMV